MTGQNFLRKHADFNHLGRADALIFFLSCWTPLLIYYLLRTCVKGDAVRLLLELPQAPGIEVKGMLENKKLFRVHLLRARHCPRSFRQTSNPKAWSWSQRAHTSKNQKEQESGILDADDTSSGVLRKEKFLWAGWAEMVQLEITNVWYRKELKMRKMKCLEQWGW